MVEGPVDIFPGLGLEARIVEEPGKRNETIEKIWAALPRLAGAPEPSAVGADVFPGFIQVAAQPVGLRPQLLFQPARGADGAQRQKMECAAGERRAIPQDGRCVKSGLR